MTGNLIRIKGGVLGWDPSGINTEFKRYLKKGLILVKNLDSVYDSALVTQKQIILRSVCKGNLQFQESAVRTGEVNDLLRLIATVSGEQRGNENKTGGDFRPLSIMVIPFGFEPKAYGLENRCSIQLSYGINMLNDQLVNNKNG
jgi:hypothetical protein